MPSGTLVSEPSTGSQLCVLLAPMRYHRCVLFFARRFKLMKYHLLLVVASVPVLALLVALVLVLALVFVEMLRAGLVLFDSFGSEIPVDTVVPCCRPSSVKLAR